MSKHQHKPFFVRNKSTFIGIVLLSTGAGAAVGLSWPGLLIGLGLALIMFGRMAQEGSSS